MNNLQLQCAIESSAVSRRFNIGVYAADQLPYRVMDYPQGFIINNQTSRQMGKHWIAIWLDSPNYGDFFDSFGKRPNHYGKQFQDFLQRNVEHYQYNNRVFQSDDSVTCGLYALYYIMLKARGYSLKRIQNSLTSNTMLNDNLMYTFAHLSFNQCMY